MRTAVILLSLMAVAAIPGSLLPQRNVASDPGAVLQFAQEHPTLAPWLDRLGLFDVYASPWFAAIYLLLLISMTGCVIPRCARLWRQFRTSPAGAPKHLGRLEGYLRVPSVGAPDRALSTAANVLVAHGYRVNIVGLEVRAERGRLRELGNLAFHLSLLVLLLGVGIGRLFGFEGRVAVVEGGTFTNARSYYDSFTPSVWTDEDNLDPFTFSLKDFSARFETSGDRAGEPRGFNARLTYSTGDVGTGQTPAVQPQETSVRPNAPLVVGGTKVFLTGHGYAPVVTVRDGRGDIAFSGPVIFLPLDSNLTSEGVVKVPDAAPDQLGFQGLFLPTARIDENGPMSAFPDLLDPRLVLTAFQGDLGMDGGSAQSVYVLDTERMRQVLAADGQPLARSLAVGESMRLPDGAGSLRFDRVVRFANFQIAYDPGKEISLAAGLLLLIGLTVSLTVRRGRIWVRIAQGRVEIAGQSLSRRPLPQGDFDAVLDAVLRAQAVAPRSSSSTTPNATGSSRPGVDVNDEETPT